MKVLIAANTAWNFINFRKGLILELIRSQHEVFAVAPEDASSEAFLRSWRVEFVSIEIDSHGLNPFRDFSLFYRYCRLLRDIQPDAVLTFTIKPNIFLGLACRFYNTPCVANITGIGSSLSKGTIVASIIKALYRPALAKSFRVFFQNPDDKALFVSNGIVDPMSTDLVPGSGVNLNHFLPMKLAPKAHIEFLFFGRLLEDKGIREYVAAARILLSRNLPVKFCVLGSTSPGKKESVSESELREWSEQGLINYLGQVQDVRPVVGRADCVVLPSYSEGTPKSLLEAAAMARPIITTDVPGCREIVVDNKNGFLCRPCDAVHLAERMLHFIDLAPAIREKMGAFGRIKVEREFNEEIVITRYLHALTSIASSTKQGAN